MDYEDATEAAFNKLGLTVRNIRIMHPDGTEELVWMDPTGDEIGRLVQERDTAFAMQATSDRMLGEANARIAVLEDERDEAIREREDAKSAQLEATTALRRAALDLDYRTAERNGIRQASDILCSSYNAELMVLKANIAAKDARIAELKSRLACEQEKYPDAKSRGAAPKPPANPRDVILGEATTYPSAPASKPNHNPFRDFPSDPRRIGGP